MNRSAVPAKTQGRAQKRGRKTVKPEDQSAGIEVVSSTQGSKAAPRGSPQWVT